MGATGKGPSVPPRGRWLISRSPLHNVDKFLSPDDRYPIDWGLPGTAERRSNDTIASRTNRRSLQLAVLPV